MDILNFNSSKLKHRIIIQKLTITKTKNDFDGEEWGDFKSVKADMNNLWGREFWSAKDVDAEKTVEFIIRYSKDYEPLDTKAYRILFKNKIFNIEFFDNIKYKNKWIKIKAMEV